MPTYSHYLVVDLEATCDQPESFPRSETEIIEIGAVLLDAATFEVVREFQTFVRPRRHPRLTAFCTQLTTITQEQVDAAPRFPQALQELIRFRGQTGALLCSWGRYDWNQLQRDIRYHRRQMPFKRHFNVKDKFSEVLGSSRRFGVRGALREVRLRFVGTPHRGIDDARNIARLLPYAMGERPFPRADEGRGDRRGPARRRHR